MEAPLTKAIAGSAPSSSMIRRDASVTAPRTAAVGVPREKVAVSSPSRSESSIRATSTDPVVLPAGMSRVAGEKVKSAPSVAVPETVTGTVTSKPLAALSSTPREALGSSSTAIVEADEKEIDGASSSSRTVRSWLETAPAVAFCTVERVIVSTSSGSSVESDTAATESEPVRLPPGITSCADGVTDTSTPPGVADPERVKSRVTSSVRASERVSPTEVEPAPSGRLLVATSNSRVAAASSSSITSSYSVIDPSAAPVGAPRVRMTRSSPSETASSLIVMSIVPPNCPAPIVRGEASTVTSDASALPPSVNGRTTSWVDGAESETWTVTTPPDSSAVEPVERKDTSGLKPEGSAAAAEDSRRAATAGVAEGSRRWRRAIRGSKVRVRLESIGIQMTPVPSRPRAINRGGQTERSKWRGAREPWMDASPSTPGSLHRESGDAHERPPQRAWQ